MIVVRGSSRFTIEKKYICNVIFSEFLGVDYLWEDAESLDSIEILCPNGNCVSLSSVWWNGIGESYVSRESLPVSVTSTSNDFILESDIPLLFGTGEITKTDSRIDCGIDIFATCFLMLSRLEEAIITARDVHDRFEVKNSLAFKFNFLERPVVDEYVEMLWNMLKYLDPALERKRLNYKNLVSCDVDFPFDPIRQSFWLTIRRAIRDIIKKNSFTDSFRTLSDYIYNLIGIPKKDEFRENISWMMDVNEQRGNRVAFYFITDPSSVFDPRFDFHSKEMTQLVKEISDRGHEIGIHPGYECYKSSLKFNQAVKILNRLFLDHSIKQEKTGGRMHCLRYDIVETPSLWKDAGLSYDSSLGFAENPGFRCGTCREFSMFDLRKRRPLDLKQIPLIVMECSIVEEKYEGLGYSMEAEERFLLFKCLVKKYDGNFTLLWHNSNFPSEESKAMYARIVV